VNLRLVPVSKTLPLKIFDCGNDNLNEYLKRYAVKNDAARIGKTFAALTEEDLIAGYITLSNAQIEREKLPPDLKLPRYPVPALRIGKLAVSRELQGKGIGAWLLFKALEKAIEIAEIAAVYAVLVDAIDANAKRFYLKYGFIPLQNSEFTLYLPLETILSEFKAL
jgi:GNAT superfamily N-acetyltransferase